MHPALATDRKRLDDQKAMSMSIEAELESMIQYDGEFKPVIHHAQAPDGSWQHIESGVILENVTTDRKEIERNAMGEEDDRAQILREAQRNAEIRQLQALMQKKMQEMESDDDDGMQ